MRKYRNSFVWFNLKAIIITILLVVESGAFSKSIQTQFNHLAKKLVTISKKRPSETVYLSTNKGCYDTGEDLWFKANVLNSQLLIPSATNHTLWLEMINESSRQCVWKEKYELKNGVACGHVFVNDSLSEGSYLLIACTQNSFYKSDKEFKDARQILVRKDMKPKLILTTKFSKKFYSPNDSLRVEIQVRDEHKIPQQAEITAILMDQNLELERVKLKSGYDGEAFVKFQTVQKNKELHVKFLVKHKKPSKILTKLVPLRKACPVVLGFYPEGGNLINGIESKVAFKSINQRGQPEAVEAVLYENGDSLLTFNSVHDGMGCFVLKPNAGNKYKVKIIKPLIDSLFSLPCIEKRGVAMELKDREKQKLKFLFKQPKGFKDKKLIVRGQMRGVVYCMASGVLKEQLEISLPLKHFPLQGIAEFTVFDSNMIPIAERLVYVNQEKRLNVEIKFDKEKYKIRDKVKINFKLTDSKHKPVIANLGATVFDKVYENIKDGKNILTHFHLFTQLRGTIHNPNYYFNKQNVDRAKHLDLLMLTHGWRKYIWREQELSNNYKESPVCVVTDGINASLYPTDNEDEAVLEGNFVMAHNSGRDKVVDFLNVEKDGKVIIPWQDLKQWQGGFLYLKPMGNEEFGFKLKLENPFDSLTQQLNLHSIVNYKHKPSLKIASNLTEFVPDPSAIEIDEVLVVREPKSQFRDKYIGHLDSLAQLDLAIGWVCKHQSKEHYYLNGYREGYDHKCNAKVRHKPVDGETYRMIKYETADNGLNYVKDVYTMVYKAPKLSYEELLEKFNLYPLKAYYKERKFYHQTYDKVQQKNFMVPDYRNCLYWNPSITTNKNGEASIEFFCSDIHNRFVINVEGVDGNGCLGVGKEEFYVND
jgi:hypothetical protein